MTLQAGAASEVVPKDAAEAASPFLARYFAENATAAAMDLEGVTEKQLALLATFFRESRSEPFVETSGKLPSWSGEFDLEVSTSLAGAHRPRRGARGRSACLLQVTWHIYLVRPLPSPLFASLIYFSGVACSLRPLFCSL